MIRQKDMTVYCNCLRFEQYVLLCRHIFYVLRFLDIREFPKQYILRRRTREVVPNNEPGAILRYEGETERSVEVNCVVSEITYVVEANINKLVTNFEELSLFRDSVVHYLAKADESRIDAPRPSRRDRFAELTSKYMSFL